MLSLIYIPDDTPSTLTHKLTNLYEMIEMQPPWRMLHEVPFSHICFKCAETLHEG